MMSAQSRPRVSDVALALALLLLIGLSTYYFFEQNARSERMERRADRMEHALVASQEDLQVSTAQTRRMIQQVQRRGLTPAVSPTEIPTGPEGPAGVQGPRGTQGIQGLPGLPGRGVSAIALDGCYLVIGYTTGTTTRLGPICGPSGDAGAAGPAGPAGADGKDGQNGVDGKDGQDGQDGRGVASIALRCDDNPDTVQPGDGTVTFVFTFSDGTTQELASTTECQTT